MAVAACLAHELDKYLDKYRPGPGEPGARNYYISRLVLLKTLQQALEMDFSRGVYSQNDYIKLRPKLEKLIAGAARHLESVSLTG